MRYGELLIEALALPLEQRQTLMIALVESMGKAEAPHDLTELEGLGEELWQTVDSDAYLRTLRQEWDEREDR